MRPLLILAVLAAPLPAAAQSRCDEALGQIEANIQGAERAKLVMDQGERQGVSGLLQAARAFDQAGLSGRCLEVARLLSPALGLSEDLLGRNALGYEALAGQVISTLPAFVSVDALIGEEVYSAGPADTPAGSDAGVELGEVVGAVERFDRITHLVIEHGELLGLGGERQPIALGDLRWNVEEERLETSVEPDSFEARPTLTQEENLWVSDEPIGDMEFREYVGD
jgi:hypothetical protein